MVRALPLRLKGELLLDVFLLLSKLLGRDAEGKTAAFNTKGQRPGRSRINTQPKKENTIRDSTPAQASFPSQEGL